MDELNIDWSETYITCSIEEEGEHTLSLNAVTHIMQMLRPHNESLLFFGCVEEAVIGPIADHFRNKDFPTSLAIMSGSVGAEAVRFAEVLKVNSTLINLQFVSANIPDEAGAELFKALATNSTLKELELCSNRLAALAAVEIGQCLQLNSTLLSLDLSANRFREHDLIEIMSGLSTNTALRTLNLSSTTFGKSSLASLLQIIPSSPLTELNLSNCNLDVNDLLEIANAMKNNTCLRKLHLCDNLIADEGMLAFGKMLAQNTSLLAFYLPTPYAPFSWEDEFFECISQNYTLTGLAPLPRQMKERFAELIERNKAMQSDSRFKNMKPATNE